MARHWPGERCAFKSDGGDAASDSDREDGAVDVVDPPPQFQAYTDQLRWHALKQRCCEELEEGQGLCGTLEDRFFEGDDADPQNTGADDVAKTDSGNDDNLLFYIAQINKTINPDNSKELSESVVQGENGNNKDNNHTLRDTGLGGIGSRWVNDSNSVMVGGNKSGDDKDNDRDIQGAAANNINNNDTERVGGMGGGILCLCAPGNSDDLNNNNNNYKSAGDNTPGSDNGCNNSISYNLAGDNTPGYDNDCNNSSNNNNTTGDSKNKTQ